MSREIFTNVTTHEKRVAVLVDKRIEEFYIERAESLNLVGNIYKARVESVVQGMAAAFIELGLEKNGFLHVADVVTDASSYEKMLEGETGEDTQRPERSKTLPMITEVLKKGDEVLVQVVKEPISTKGARLTTHISIPGRFLVLMPFEKGTGLSKRIEDRNERDRIRKIFEELKLSDDIGFIVRTAAIGASKNDIFREARYLTRLWQHINIRGKRARPPQLVHQEYDLSLRSARDLFTNDVTKLEIDSKNDFRRISKFLRIYSPHLRSRLKFYNGTIPLFEKYDIEKQIDKIYERTVRLKSGGYLVFDETESLVAIDVNSGKFVGKKNQEDTAYRTNLEAAQEVPRQFKLRDIGGIIIIDFIDMEAHSHRSNVFKTLEKALEDDKAKTEILNISRLGLVEMTRQRMRKSVESKSYGRCPYCNGRGIIKSVSTIAIEMVRRLERALQETKAKDTSVYLHPDVASYIQAPGRNMIRPLERRFRKTIRIITDPNQHIEDIKIQ
ncbi:MAG: Rne/Rng family ribonuclease [Candidatus Omnitrophica bacterium]|nr:Rne/Rng family ribonuclease [Candidatus Omnitrophota bacterium]